MMIVSIKANSKWKLVIMINSITSLSTATLCIMTLRIIIVSILPNSIMILSIVKLCMTTPSMQH